MAKKKVVFDIEDNPEVLKRAIAKLEQDAEELQKQLAGIPTQIEDENDLQYASDKITANKIHLNPQAIHLEHELGNIRSRIEKKKGELNKLISSNQHQNQKMISDAEKQYIKNLHQKIIQANELEVTLDTGIKAVNGISSRKHDYRYRNGKPIKNAYSATSISNMFHRIIKDDDKSFKALGQSTGDSEATVYGTLVHKLLEEAEKGAFGKIHKGKTVDEKQIEQFLEKLASSSKAEDQADAKAYTMKWDDKIKGFVARNNLERKNSVKQFHSAINTYFGLKDNMGLGDTKVNLTEKPLGAKINVKGKPINIVGTLDQLISSMMVDFKTGKGLDESYGLQIAVLKMLAKVAGINVGPGGQLMFLPRNPKQTPGVVKVDDLEIDKTMDLISIAIEMKEAQSSGNIDKMKSLYKQGRKLLGTGGLHTLVGENSYIDKQGVERTGTTLNGHYIGDLGKMLTADELNDVINGIDDIKQRTRIQRKIADSPYYNSQTFKDLREKFSAFMPSDLNTNISQELLDKRDDKGNLLGSFKSYKIGNRSFSSWISKIARLSPAKREEEFSKLVGIFERNLIQPSAVSADGSWAEADALRYAVTLGAINNINESLIGNSQWLGSELIPEESKYYSELYDFLSNNGKLEDWIKKAQEEQKPWHDLSDIGNIDFKKITKDEFVEKRMKGVSSLKDIEESLANAPNNHLLNDVLKGFGLADKSYMELMPDGASKALAKADWNFDPRKDQMAEEERLEDYTGSAGELRSRDEIQVAHKLAYLYFAPDLYEQTFKDAWEKYKIDHKDKYSEDYKEFLLKNVTHNQMYQWTQTAALKNEIDKLAAQGYDWSDILYLMGQNAADVPNYIEEIVGTTYDEETGRTIAQPDIPGVPGVLDTLRSLSEFYKQTSDRKNYAERFAGPNPEDKDDFANVVADQIGNGKKWTTMTRTGALSSLLLQGSPVIPMFRSFEAQDKYLGKIPLGENDNHNWTNYDDRVSRYQTKSAQREARVMAKFRDSITNKSLYYAHPNEGDRHFLKVFLYNEQTGKWSPRTYLYETDSAVYGQGDLVICPTSNGDVPGSVGYPLYNVTEEAARGSYTGPIYKIKGRWIENKNTATNQDTSSSEEISNPDDFNIIGLDEEVEKRNEQISAESLLGDTTAAPVNVDAPVASSSTSEPASPAKKRGRPKGSGKAAKPSTKEIQAVQETVKEVVEDKVEAVLSSPETATPSRMSAADKQEIIHKGIQHVEHMKITAENINIKNVENNVNNYPKGTGAFAPAGASGGDGKRKGKAAEAAEVAPEEKLERLMRRIEIQYEGNLKDQLKILDNEHKIKELQKENTSESAALAKSLGESNNYLKEQIAGRQAKIDKFKQTEGVDTSELDRRYQIYLALQKNQYNYDKAHRESGGNNKGSKKPNYYSLDGRIVWWFERMINGGLLMSFFNIIKKGLTDAIKIAKELDKAMTNIRIVTGTTRAEAQQLTGEFINLSKQLGASAQDVLNAASEFYRQGYQTADVLELVESTTKLSKLGMIDMSKATQDLTSALKGFKMASNESIKVVDKLTAIDMQAAVTAGEIAEGLSQFANLANVNGVNLDQAAAYVATIAEVTQNSGSAVGSSLKMIMSRYGNVKAGAYNKLNVNAETMDNSQDLNDVEKVLKKLGISIRDANLHFKDFDTILDELAERWVDLDNVTKRAISTSFAGKQV